MGIPATGVQAAREQELRLVFRCDACDHKAKAVVLGRGQGSGVALMHLDVDGAARRAGAAATAGASKNARRLLELVACPACGHADGGAWTRAWLRVALIATAAAAPGLAAGGFIAVIAGGRGGFPLTVGLGLMTLGAVIGIAIAVSLAWPLGDVAGRVSFESADAKREDVSPGRRPGRSTPPRRRRRPGSPGRPPPARARG